MQDSTCAKTLRFISTQKTELYRLITEWNDGDHVSGRDLDELQVIADRIEGVTLYGAEVEVSLLIELEGDGKSPWESSADLGSSHLSLSRRGCRGFDRNGRGRRDRNGWFQRWSAGHLYSHRCSDLRVDRIRGWRVLRMDAVHGMTTPLSTT